MPLLTQLVGLNHTECSSSGTTHADHLTEDIPCTSPVDDSLIEGDYELNAGVSVNHFNKNGLNPTKLNVFNGISRTFMRK